MTRLSWVAIAGRQLLYHAKYMILQWVGSDTLTMASTLQFLHTAISPQRSMTLQTYVLYSNLSDTTKSTTVIILIVQHIHTQQTSPWRQVHLDIPAAVAVRIGFLLIGRELSTVWALSSRTRLSSP
jgi:hypothetical protein